MENISGDAIAMDNLPLDADQPETVVAPIEEKIPEETPEVIKTDGEKEKPKKLGGFQKTRIKQQKEIADLKAQIALLSSKATAVVDKEPLLEDYSDWNAYNKDLIKYESGKLFEARQKQEITQKEAVKESENITTWEAKIEALDEDKYEAYHKMIDEYKDIDVRQQIIKSAQNSSIGPEILLHLDKNPELFDKLNHKDISDLSIKREISALEAQLTNNQKPAVKGSKSPAPITPIKGSSPTSVDDKDLDTDAYIAKYHSKLLRK